MNIKNTIIKISIPISDYYGEEVFFQDLYFDHSPSKDFVVNILRELHERSLKHEMYLGCWGMCLEAVNNSIGWEFIHHSIIQSTIRTETKHTHGQSYISFQRVDVFAVN